MPTTRTSHISPPAVALRAKPLRPILSREERRFVEEFPADCDPIAAARRADLDPQSGPRLLQRTTVRAALEVALSTRARRLQIEHDFILRRWTEMLSVDAREFVEHWRVACRHCHGVNHRFQFTDGELIELEIDYDAAYAAGQDEARKSFNPRPLPHLGMVRNQIDAAFLAGRRGIEPPSFDSLGGGGYSVLTAPARGVDWVAFAREHSVGVREPKATAPATCPECGGWGESFTIFHDTRDFGPGAARLFEGVEATPKGFKVLTRKREQIEEFVARHAGVLPTPNAKPPATLDPDFMTEEQIDAVLAAHGRVVEDVEYRDTSDEVDRIPGPVGGEEAAAPAEEGA